jgi:NADPH2:quinone reductase
VAPGWRVWKVVAPQDIGEGNAMRAIVIREFGGPETLAVVELPDPVPGPGEVLIEVAAAGVNRVDVLVRTGRYHRAGQPPLRLGVEGAGIVRAVGDRDGEIAVGQRVVAMGATNEPGFYAELAVVPAVQVIPVPDGVDLQSAAALPTAWLSAWYCLRRLADLQPGEWVLVHAAASGVGSAAVQIALDAGATVVATAGSAEKCDWVRGLGAQHVLDSSKFAGQLLVDEVLQRTGGRGIEVALDLVGGQSFADSLRAIGFAGRVVAMANVALAPSTVDTRDFYPKNARIFGFQITNLMDHGYDPRPDLVELLDGIAAGRFAVPIDVTFPLSRAADAHRYLEQRANKGKVLLLTGAQ